MSRFTPKATIRDQLQDFKATFTTDFNIQSCKCPKIYHEIFEHLEGFSSTNNESKEYFDAKICRATGNQSIDYTYKYP